MKSSAVAGIIRSLPKTEIHIHAEATVTFDTYFKLNQKYGSDLGKKSPADFRKLLKMDNLSTMIRNFLYLQSLFKSSEDFSLIVPDIAAYARRNNIWYIELFIAPSMVLRQGNIDFAGIMDPLVEGFQKLATEGPDIRLLVDVSRTFGQENASNNLKHVLSYLSRRSTDRILGIGLGGAESGNHARNYISVFKAAREAGLHTVAHAGEEVGPESIYEAVNDLHAERIGHGTSAIQDEKLMTLLQERAIPLEICPTSNLITQKYVKRYEEHPLRKFFDRGMIITINTDDPVLFDIELNGELELTCEKLNFDLRGLAQLLRNGIRATFMNDARKMKALANLDSAIQVTTNA